MAAPTPEPLRLGATFYDRYEVIEGLKSGGMGTVYKVHDITTDSYRALETMHPNLAVDAESRKRFGLEARVTGPIESDHIVKVFDAGVDPKTSMPFLVMELLNGRDLGSVLEQRLEQQQGPLTPEDVVTYLWQVALALDRTHGADIIHRATSYRSA